MHQDDSAGTWKGVCCVMPVLGQFSVVQQVGQRNSIQIVVNQAVQLLPHRAAWTAFHAGACGVFGSSTGDWREIALRQP